MWRATFSSATIPNSVFLIQDKLEKDLGVSAMRPQPPRNAELVPKRYVENAKGMFEPHIPEEHKTAMEDYCAQIPTDKVVAYCHYCTEGLNIGDNKEVYHLAELFFAPKHKLRKK